MPERLPENWSRTPLGELFEMQLGKMLSKEASNGPCQAPYLANRHVQWDRVVMDHLDTMSFSAAEREKFDLRAGDLLVCEGGEVGRTALWQAEVADVFFQKAIHRLRPLNGRIEPAYMLRFMRRAAETGAFTDLSSQSSIAHLTREKLALLRVPTPPLSEQRQIATILDTIDDAIRRTEQIVTKLNQVKQGLLRDLLTCGIDDNGELRDPERNPDQFKDSPLGRIPSGWEAAHLGTYLTGCGGFLQTGPFGSQLHSSEYSAEGVPVVMPQDISDEGVSAESVARIPERIASRLARHRMKSNDLVFARRGDLSRCAPIGKREVDWICGTGCLLARLPEHALDAEWLAAAYRHDAIQRQVAGRAVGSTMANLNTGILQSLVLPIPDRAEQRTISIIARTHGLRVANEALHLDKLRLLKRGLVEDLLTGRVRVVLGDAKS